MWNVITKDNKYYPDTDRLVLGYYARIGEFRFNPCRYNKEKKEWYDVYGNIVQDPDYWTELPDFEKELT